MALRLSAETPFSGRDLGSVAAVVLTRGTRSIFGVAPGGMAFCRTDRGGGRIVTVYVSLPQIPLTLKFEEDLETVVTRFQQLIGDGEVHRYTFTDHQAVLVNYGVIASATFSEGPRTLEVSELNRGLSARIDDA
jgi:hypothetical protein